MDRLAPVTRDTPATIRTTGWIKVYAVDDEWSLVTVTHACDTIEVDDYLEPFKLPVVPRCHRIVRSPSATTTAR